MDPASYNGWFDLGLTCSETGNMSAALAAYEHALAAKPDSADARYNFALLLKQANYVADAVNELEKILAGYPGDSRAHLALGNIYAQQLRQPARGASALSQSAGERPAQPPGRGDSILAGGPSEVKSSPFRLFWHRTGCHCPDIEIKIAAHPGFGSI